jgi:hypothetical protein
MGLWIFGGKGELHGSPTSRKVREKWSTRLSGSEIDESDRFSP